MKISDLFEDFDKFANDVESKYALETFFAWERGDEIRLSMIKVPKKSQGQGIGSSVLNDLITYADDNNKRITLTAGQRDKRHGTTSHSRLVKFYKRFGFVENKGRNKDFSISDGMYREPKKHSV